MSNIQTFLNKILSARYGKDVRQAIHDAIQEVDKVADTAQGSATRSAQTAANHEASAMQYATQSKTSETNAKTYAEQAKASAEQAISTTPEGYNDLVNQVGLMDIKTTTDSTLHNSKDGGARLVHMSGNVVQDGEPTPTSPIAIKNTGDCVEMMQGSYGWTTGNYNTSESYICSKDKLPCESGDVIKIVTETELDNGGCVFFDEHNTYISYSSIANESVREITVPSGVKYFVFQLASTKGITPQTVGKITLTINDKYVVPIETHGKNFIKPVNTGETNLLYNTPITTSGITATLNSDNSVTLVGTSTKSNVFFNLNYIPNRKSIPNGKYVSSGSSSKVNVQVVSSDNSIAVTTDKEFTVDDMNTNNWVRVQIPVASTTVNETIYPMLRKADITDNTYEPYTEHTEYILLDEPLRKVGDVADRIVEVDDVWGTDRCFKEDILNSAALCERITNGYRLTCFISEKCLTSLANLSLCTVATYGNESDNVNTFSFYEKTGRSVYIRVPKETLPNGTIDEANEWLNNNDVRVLYPIETPTFTPLDTESQKALNRLKTFNGSTYIEIDSVVKPSEVEVQYGTSQVGAYTLRALNENNIDKIERAEMKVQLEYLSNKIELI